MSGDSLPQKHFTMCPSMAVPFTETMAWAALSWEENLKRKKAAAKLIKRNLCQAMQIIHSIKTLSWLTHHSTEVKTNNRKGHWHKYWLACMSHAVCLCWHLEAKCCNGLRHYLMKEYPFSGKTLISIIWPNGEKVCRIRCSARIKQKKVHVVSSCAIWGKCMVSNRTSSVTKGCNDASLENMTLAW